MTISSGKNRPPGWPVLRSRGEEGLPHFSRRGPAVSGCDDASNGTLCPNSFLSPQPPTSQRLPVSWGPVSKLLNHGSQCLQSPGPSLSPRLSSRDYRHTRPAPRTGSLSLRAPRGPCPCTRRGPSQRLPLATAVPPNHSAPPGRVVVSVEAVLCTQGAWRLTALETCRLPAAPPYNTAV